MSQTNSSELRGAVRHHLRRANRRILKNKENLNPTPTIEVQRLEDELDLFAIDWEQQMNDLKAELNQAKEDKQKFENLFEQECNLIIKPLVNDMIESIVKEIDNEKMKQNLNQEKRKKRKLD